MHTPSYPPSAIKEMLQELLVCDMPIFIHGSPGIGKSYIVNEVANMRGWEIIDIRLSQLDAIDLRGIPTIKDEETIWMTPVFLPKVKKEGILFLDELNAAPPSVQAAIYQLVLDRKLGEYTLPQGWRIVCAGNRINDRGVVFKIPSPLANRMVHLVMESSYEDFKLWAILNNIHPMIVAFLGFRPDLLSQESPKETETNPAFATPRSWAMLSTILTSSTNLKKLDPLIYGCVGYGVGLEFISYMDTFKELPSIEEIFARKEVEISTTPSALYALCAAILSYFDGTEENLATIVELSHRLPVEFAVMLIKDCITKYPDSSDSKEIDGWLERYGEYIL